MSTSQADVFFVPDSASDEVVRVNNAGVQSIAADSGLSSPEDVAFDAAGNMYVADSTLGSVLKFAPGGAGPTTVGDSVPGIASLAFGPGGELYVLSKSDDIVKKLVGNAFVLHATLLPDNATPVVPQSMRVTPDGLIYVADTNGNRVFEVTPAGAVDVFSSDVTAPHAVAIDAAGKVHVTDQEEGGRIASFTGSGNNPQNNAKTDEKNLGAIRGLAYDRSNTAHFLTSTGELRKIVGNSSEGVTTGLGNNLLTAVAPIRQVIAFKGQTLSVPNSAIFASFGSPATGGDLVAFKATLLPPAGGVATANNLGLWIADSTGSLELVARKTFAAPGIVADPGKSVPTIQSVGDPILNDAGNIAFIGTLQSSPASGVTAANNIAIFSDVGGALRPLLRKGQSAPGLDPLIKVTAFKQLVLPDDSGPAVLASIAGPGVSGANNFGLWSADATGTFSLVLRKGTTINVGGKDRVLSTLGMFTPTPLSLGQGRHYANAQKFTLLAKFTDGFTAILRVGVGQAPEVVAEKLGSVLAGASYSTFGSPAMIADASATAYRAKLLNGPGGITAANANAIFVRTATTDLVAQTSFSAPDVPSAIFALLGDPVVSPSGSLAFFGKMKPGLGAVLSSNAAGLWQDLGDGLKLAVRQADRVLDLRGTVKFTAFKQFVLPDTGGVVFTAMIAGTDVTAANNFGLWAHDGDGGTEMLVRKGDRITIGDKERTITKVTVLTAAAGVTGQSRQFDANGTVTCHVKCSDGTQAILVLRRL